MKQTNSNKQLNQVPFDIELAKKIQSGEVEGRIVTTVGGAARIVCFDKKTKTRYPLVVLVHDLRYPDIESVGYYTTKGEVVGDEIYNLCIELPEETPEEQHPIEESELYQAGYKVGFEAGRCVAFDEKKECAIKKETPKHEFKPFDKVLVRCADWEKWSISHFGYIDINDGHFICSHNTSWKQCIPYEGNEHLVGTTNNPESL